ncbi:sulfatase-like hydrolase/transferase [Niabella drilacis]|uniref:Arylsulfatase A n=1 Tax=Niabella drilacis (strain DSM 25811 / CCM 8410 / CCUG 62505 / LMG 26954 / E90) TaxID=1285928 RepID=A0A1G6ZR71_NIADE|nr:sulfatase-like hydrolase/transferase [Niabella drilacis]SDE04992.1 Arylsulfatase A [Niabella drilacis]
MRKLFLFSCLLLVSGIWAQTGRLRPNIIFILVDDLGYGDVGVFHQNARKALKDPAVPFMVTPALDRMASNGTIFTQQYANAPVCVSSRSSLLTGVTQGHAVVRNNQFDRALEDNYTIASTLKAAGYNTVAIGKWGLQGTGKEDWPGHPLRRGFDAYYGYIRHSDGHEHYPKEGLYRKTKEVYDNTANVTEGLDKCYTGDLWTARAKQWIMDYKKSKNGAPFFMYLAYDTPHAVIELPTQAYPGGSGLTGGLQWIGKPGQMINTASGNIDSWMAPEFKNATYLDKATGKMVPWKDVNKRYATVVQRLDAQVGDLLQLLKDLKIDENTMVVFTSDNGPSAESYLKEDYTPEFFQGYGPFDGIKRDQWEGGMRTPTIVQWKGTVVPGKTVLLPSFLSDWMPTFLDAAGMTAPARTDGVSLLPALTGRGIQQRQTLYSEYFFDGKTPGYADFEQRHRNRMRNQMQFIRQGDYVGVRYDIKNSEDDFEIYDVVKDPKEKLNRAPALPALQKQFKEKVLQMRIPSLEAPRPYDSVPVASVSEKKASKGIRYQLYKGSFLWVPGTAGSGAAKSGTGSIKAAMNALSDADAGSLSGYIRVPADGAYTFYLKVNGKAFVRLHEIALLDADYGYTPGAEVQQTLLLKAGLHPIRLLLKREGPHPEPELYWSGPGFEKRLLEQGDFY